MNRRRRFYEKKSWESKVSNWVDRMYNMQDLSSDECQALEDAANDLLASNDDENLAYLLGMNKDEIYMMFDSIGSDDATSSDVLDFIAGDDSDSSDSSASSDSSYGDYVIQKSHAYDNGTYLVSYLVSKNINGGIGSWTSDPKYGVRFSSVDEARNTINRIESNSPGSTDEYAIVKVD